MAFLFAIAPEDLSFELLAEVQYARSCNENRTVGSDDHTNHQGEYKASDVVTAQHEDGQQYNERGK